ncbi:MAG: hypothetical protein WB764_03185 [Xanthobacteraceae bacterium]
MSTANRVLVVFAVALSAAAFASQVSAQDSKARDAAISKCVKQAQTQYPDDTTSNQTSRSDVYKACMATAGFAP